MKKLMLIALSVILFTACNNSKSKEGDNGSATPPKDEVKPASTGNDAMLTTWLGGKMLNSTMKDPKFDTYDRMKLNADGTLTDKDNSSAKWKVENGEFMFMASMTIKNKIDKKNDTTVVFHGQIGDDIYTLTPIK